MPAMSAPTKGRIVAAMSGGVDSSVTAALLKRQGYDVVGITLQLYPSDTRPARKGACCAGADIQDARRVAESIGIPHYVLDYEARFRKAVIEDFADTYARGETPIPCVRCNEKVKFADLLETARELGAEAMATGHYVRRVEGPQGAELQIRAELAPFFGDLPQRMAETHLVIARAGAGTVAELMAIGRPAILVPLPGALDDNQTPNADILARADAGWRVAQRDLTPDHLAQMLQEIFAHPIALAQCAASAHALAIPHAARNLADAVDRLMEAA